MPHRCLPKEQLNEGVSNSFNVTYVVELGFDTVISGRNRIFALNSLMEFVRS